jgi:hypothetical protein
LEVTLRDAGGMSRPHVAFGVLPDDLYVVPGPWPRIGRAVKHGVETWRVVDNWPARVPVTDAEIDVFNVSRSRTAKSA